jgi:hypothetical protein
MRVCCSLGSGYARCVTSDPSPPGVDSPGLSEHEEDALRMAQELQDRVRRERAVIRRLRAYLDRTVDPTES